VLVLGTASFALFGALLVLVGSTHSEISIGLGLSLAEVSLLGASLSLGLALGLLIAGPVVDRVARRPVFQCALALAGVSLCCIDANIGFSAALLFVTLAGLGAGAYETVLNTTVIGRYREHSTRPIAFLHAAATAGAVVTPGVIGWLVGEYDWPIVFKLAGCAHFALIAAGFAVDFGEAPRVPVDDPVDDGASPIGVASPSFKSPLLVCLCAVGFAYVGLETALTLLAVPYATGVLALSPGVGRTAISAFWLGLLAGRGGLFLFATRAGPLTLSLAGAASLVVLTLGIGGELPYFAWVMAALGFSLGSVFPLLISLSGQLFEHRRGTAVGLVGGIASIGGFAVPAATGVLGEASGVRVAMLSLALGCAVIAIGGGLAHRAAELRRKSQLR
jgi:MFS family permease